MHLAFVGSDGEEEEKYRGCRATVYPASGMSAIGRISKAEKKKAPIQCLSLYPESKDLYCKSTQTFPHATITFCCTLPGFDDFCTKWELYAQCVLGSV